MIMHILIMMHLPIPTLKRKALWICVVLESGDTHIITLKNRHFFDDKCFTSNKKVNTNPSIPILPLITPTPLNSLNLCEFHSTPVFRPQCTGSTG